MTQQHRCKCGCNGPVAAGKTYIRGHYWAHQHQSELPTCEVCSKDIAGHQRCGLCTILCGPKHDEHIATRWQGVPTCSGCYDYIQRMGIMRLADIEVSV